jgi:hypothetical protein
MLLFEMKDCPVSTCYNIYLHMCVNAVPHYITQRSSYRHSDVGYSDAMLPTTAPAFGSPFTWFMHIDCKGGGFERIGLLLLCSAM